MRSVAVHLQLIHRIAMFALMVSFYRTKLKLRVNHMFVRAISYKLDRLKVSITFYAQMNIKSEFQAL